MVFYPRTDAPGHSRVTSAIDGTIPVEKDIALGYRLYPHQPDAPLVVYFHGNGEIASDYDDAAQAFQRIGASLLVVDYRGYGWSTGRPLVSALLSDVEAVQKALPEIRTKGNIGNVPLYLMGRSLGSIPAVHMAHLYPDQFKGLIIESGFAHVMPWLASKGLPVMGLPDPIANADKVSQLPMPLLVLHGERDTLVPPSQGQALYDASPATHKQILIIPRAGHNDIMYVGLSQYFAAIHQLLQSGR